jgi:hypothetical protein
MMRLKVLYLTVLLVLPVIAFGQAKETENQINEVISNWHKSAAKADFETYTNLMTENAVFIGTDPTEYWEGQEFRDFAKPYFDNGKAWTFYTLKRNVFVDIKYKVAWFDELLDTQMGICRGSGVLVYVDEQWKINHYVLSITIPNENVEEVKNLKADFESQFVEKVKN